MTRQRCSEFSKTRTTLLRSTDSGRLGTVSSQFLSRFFSSSDHINGCLAIDSVNIASSPVPKLPLLEPRRRPSIVLTRTQIFRFRSASGENESAHMRESSHLIICRTIYILPRLHRERRSLANSQFRIYNVTSISDESSNAHSVLENKTSADKFGNPIISHSRELCQF